MVSQIFTVFSLISVILSSTSGMGKVLGYFLNFNSLDYFVDSVIKPIRIQSISVVPCFVHILLVSDTIQLFLDPLLKTGLFYHSVCGSVCKRL